MIDIHSHILPGMDDGAADRGESLAMLREAAKAGVTGIFATPHAAAPLSRRGLEAACRELTPEAAALGITLRVGVETRYDLLARLDRYDLTDYCYQGTKTLLLEFPEQISPSKWECTLCELKESGFQVIIAHPERYRIVQRNPDLTTEFRRYGALIQLDAESFAGRPWNRDRITAAAILKAGTADFIASDAHRAQGYRLFDEIHRKLADVWPPGRNVFS